MYLFCCWLLGSLCQFEPVLGTKVTSGDGGNWQNEAQAGVLLISRSGVETAFLHAFMFLLPFSVWMSGCHIQNVSQTLSNLYHLLTYHPPTTWKSVLGQDHADFYGLLTWIMKGEKSFPLCLCLLVVPVKGSSLVMGAMLKWASAVAA